VVEKLPAGFDTQLGRTWPAGVDVSFGQWQKLALARGFMRENPMTWVGLIQAYLLMTIVAVLLILGSREVNTRKWHVVGALAHCPPLIAALSSLSVFASMGVGQIIWVPIAFHIVFFCVETFAALLPNPSD